MTVDILRRPLPGDGTDPATGDRGAVRRSGVGVTAFFLAAIALTLTAGATWGAALLVRLAAARSFTALSVFEVNAHGQAQIYGWVGLFVFGAAYLLLPRFLGVELAHPALARASLPLLLGGTVLRAVSEPFPTVPPLPTVALAATIVQLAAIGAFATVAVATIRRAPARGATRRYLLAAVAWFGAASVLDLVHLQRLLATPGKEALLRQVATWQYALREAQVHGLALTLIFGMSLWLLPALFGRRVAMQTRARRLFWPLQLALVAEIAAFVTFMTTRNPAWAGVMWAAELVFAGSALAFVAGLGLWRRGAPGPRELPFLRAAHGWLAVSLLMLVAAPLWSAWTGEHFSHAWYGATRHAVTVGFVSLTIVGVGARLVRGMTGRPLPRAVLVATFVLLNLGCTLRVTMQAATDVAPSVFPLAGASGFFEVAGLAVWGAAMARGLLGGNPDEAAVGNRLGSAAGGRFPA